ncbi:SDR family NAD(P)-dependent oxidoreductase [Jeotgalibacillus campisalis]|uniref:Oxidoreductase n=1 Tax=Jeotgalibacillus campisalis TaxID=220754 RepID=A0A0C2VA93_9BACL|nr:SDR family oxidoreductase [Jeotgalibacillus campisalis]KIL45897.1 oxidoreductase [Jeotgalibacillus campisalis]
MSRKLEGKKIMITGASSGLGVEIAKKCAQQGAILLLVGRNESRLEAIVQECCILGAREVLAYPYDLRNVHEIPSLINSVNEKAEGIDVLINNAGFGLFERLDQTSIQTVQDMFNVNVLSLIILTKSVIPIMKRGNKAHIINIASQAGKLATPKSSIYSATKFAVIGFSNSLRMELAEENIAVTVINPGPIDTSFFDQADSSGTYAKSVKRYMLNPEKVASKTVQSIFTNKREINLPAWMNGLAKIHTLFPSIVEAVGKKGFHSK